ncbi:hypothetical protein WJX72_000806 [[Myrmecia] bisecta]|uniref:Fungal lipase-type domain-containing protein n=1 Tax=[Myrmecia] bisecta TaxID=41462 RepID=A0AAW1PZD1_9CHLO
MFSALLPSALGASWGNRAAPAADAPEEPTVVNWSRVSSYLSQVAADAAFDLPALEEDLGLIRASFILAQLSQQVYKITAADLESVTQFELPLAGPLNEVAVVAARLVHVRQAAADQGLQSPQQFGVWHVDGLGLAVVFRGTASQEDVLIDANITPVPLVANERATGNHGAINVHKGFYEGAKQQIDAIVAAVRGQDRRARRRLPVWISGHSLGGGYANCVMLHMLANREIAELFAAGGGSVTFGAPMVIHSQHPDALYERLTSLEAFAERQAGRRSRPRLHFHNFVNNADVVPRLLGRSLDSVHSMMEYYVPYMQSVQHTARNYHPFGAYHMILGDKIRTPAYDGASAHLSRGRIGNFEHAEEVKRHLEVTRLWRSLYASGGRTGGYMDHSIAAYKQRVGAYMHALALDPPQSRLLRSPSRASAPNPAGLFVMLSDPHAAQQHSRGGPSGNPRLLADQVGTLVGTAAAGVGVLIATKGAQFCLSS